ncbi:MAG: AAA family ATPase [Bacteroidaceae bacterium]|nr:AAA family ATPase [Bacteroidaceae bacterium]
MINDKPKRIPYGMQNWEDVRLSNYYYVDKTRFIPEIEAANNYFFFIRPRRFGKSLLMNMLRQYYDVRKALLFDRLFGDLWIGQHPTENHNQYLVLYLNFSMVSGDLGEYSRNMNNHCRTRMEDFCGVYSDLLPQGTLEGLREKESASDMLDYLSSMAQRAGQQIYLFIDEYDHFTNDILADPAIEHAYKSQTHGTGALRQFFNVVKGSSDSAIKRAFITGVSPVTMDDLTSGFNIGTNYTMHRKFNAMVGFTEKEVRELLDYYRQHFTFKHTTDELIEIMKPWYDNYCFAKECLNEPSLYNSDMVLYFLYNYLDGEGSIPDNMLDANIRTDYNKLRMLIRKDQGFEHDASIIQSIVETGGITAALKEHFPSERLTDPDNFVSLLYYFGMLTIAGSSLRGIKFRIPNQVVREQMYGYLAQTYRDNNLSVDDYQRNTLMANMAIDGDWRPYFEFIAETLQRYSSNRDKQKGEFYVHGFTLAMTCLQKFYLPISEQDAGVKSQRGQEMSGGYADIYMQPRLDNYPDLKHSYLLELKYLPSSSTDAEVETARQTAIAQLTRYAQGINIAGTKGHTQLHRLVLVWRGMELAIAEEF